MPTFSLWTAEAEKRRGRQSQKWFWNIFSNKLVKILQIFFLSLYRTLFLFSNVVLTIVSSRKSKFKISSQPLVFLAIFNQKWRAPLPHIIFPHRSKCSTASHSWLRSALERSQQQQSTGRRPPVKPVPPVDSSNSPVRTSVPPSCAIVYKCASTTT